MTDEQREAEATVKAEVVYKVPVFDADGTINQDDVDRAWIREYLVAAVRRELKLRAYQKAVREVNEYVELHGRNSSGIEILKILNLAPESFPKEHP